MSIKKNFIYSLLLTSSNLLFPLLTFPYLTRVIGAEGLGICNFILSFSQNFSIVAALGLPAYGIREIARLGDDKAKRSKLFIELITIHSLLTILVLLLYYTVVIIHPEFQDHKQLALIGGLTILLNAFTVEWLFAGVSDFKYITIRSLIIRSLSVLFIFILVKERDDYASYFLIIVVTLLITVLVNLNYTKKYISFKIDLPIKQILIHIKPISILGLYIVLTSLYTVLPVTLLGFLSTKSAVGYYYGANKIILMIISVFGALSTVMIPKLNQAFAQQEDNKYRELLDKAFRITISIGIPMALLVYLLANPIVMILAGKEFLRSVFCLQVMAPIIILVAFAQIFVHMILFVNKRDKEMVLLAVIGVIINLGINIIFIPLYAERAAVFSLLFSEIAVFIFSFYIAKRLLNFHFPIRSTLINISFAIPFVLIVKVVLRITDSYFIQLILSASLCGAYFLVYQLYIIKDKLILENIYLVIGKLKDVVLRKQNK